MRNNPSRAVDIVCRVALAVVLFLSAGARLARAEVVLYLNPYEGVLWDQFEQSKTNLHTHTTESDGVMSPATVIDEYHSRGYGALALTDHNLSTYPWEDFGRDPNALGMVAIAGNELSRHYHTLSLFCDYTTTTTDWDTAIAGVGAAGGLAVICHPAMHWVSWSPEQYPVGPDEGDVPDSVVERYAELYRTYPHLLGTEVSNATRSLAALSFLRPSAFMQPAISRSTPRRSSKASITTQRKAPLRSAPRTPARRCRTMPTSESPTARPYMSGRPWTIATRRASIRTCAPRSPVAVAPRSPIRSDSCRPAREWLPGWSATGISTTTLRAT